MDLTKVTMYEQAGEWSISEQESHINVLELQACQMIPHSFCKNIRNQHIRIYMANRSSACSYISRFGGKMPELDAIARDIWFWCIDRKIHLSTGHVAGVENCEADQESRTMNDDTEWSFLPEVFKAIQAVHPYLSEDLFPSRLTHKLENYISRRADPKAISTDTFSYTWNNEYYFIFPPFQLDRANFKKDTGGWNRSGTCCTIVDNSKLVAQPET